MVGDSIRDIQAAQNIGMEAILVKTGKGQGALSKINEDPTLLKFQVSTYDDLYSYVNTLKPD